jgi:hypothetical protein
MKSIKDEVDFENKIRLKYIYLLADKNLNFPKAYLYYDLMGRIDSLVFDWLANMKLKRKI